MVAPRNVTLMDQLSAHLDRGWDLAQRGDAMGARACAERALALAPASAAVHNLLGFANALAGDYDDAIEAYQHAVDLDDTYVEAMMNAAELLLHPVGDADAALRLCEQALDITDLPAEVTEARLLSLEALLIKNEHAPAAAMLAKVLQHPLEDPMHNFLAGRACLELGDQARAGELLAAALAGAPDNAEVHYHHGLWCERAGDRTQACASFFHTRELDLHAGPPPWAPSGESFALFAKRAVEQLDPALKSFAHGAELYISDVPGCEVIVDGVDPRALALVDLSLAPPRPDEAPAPSGDAPADEAPHNGARIFLYAFNVLRIAGGLHDVQDAIGEALREELSAALTELATSRGDVGPLPPAAHKTARGITDKQ